MAGYNVAENWDYMDVEARSRLINSSSTEDLARWASDENCNQRFLCTVAMKKRQRDSGEEATAKFSRLQAGPFDARNEVSADARYIAGHIVKHLWIIFVILPFLLATLYELLK